MVLIVVVVQPVASSYLKIGDSIQKPPERRLAFPVTSIVDRIGFLNSQDTAVHDLAATGQAYVFQLAPSPYKKLMVGFVPQCVALRAEILHSKARDLRIR